MTNNAFENLLRSPWEWMVALCALLLALLIALHPFLFALSQVTASAVAIAILLFALLRLVQGFKIFFYKKRLLKLKHFEMGTTDIPLSKKRLYLGQGFEWLPIHRQRLHLLSQVENQQYRKVSQLKQLVLNKAEKNPKGFSAMLTTLPLSPFKPLPPVGGKPYLHGVGSDEEKAIYIEESNRNSHTLVLGMTRVGKTRLMTILVNQDIRNGKPVAALDPKGDIELLIAMVEACIAAGRKDDLAILFPPFPKWSAKYNPLSSFVNISEVATRITSAIQAEGEGKQFQDFAWKFVHIVAACLQEMGERISYASIAFYITRPKQLLLQYCQSKLSKEREDYEESIEEIMAQHSNKIDKKGNTKPAMTMQEAVQIYVDNHINETLQKGDKSIYEDVVVDLHYAASLGEEYYSKITASLGPVLDKINKTSARDVFSWDDETDLPIITLEEVIKEKKVVYLGLDSLSNAAMANAVGQAFIADLVSLCGKLYKTDPGKKFPLALHVDEFSNVVIEEFITLLNKAGGVGIEVTAYTQTVNDIGAVFGSNKDKMKMLLGNFGTMIMLRIANKDTAEVFTLCLEEIKARSSSPSTMANDRSDNDSGELFTTYNTDTVNEESKSIVTINDLYSLPKGQAFVLTNGGTVYKIRIPLPKNDSDLPESFEEIMKQINVCKK